jgi:dihydrofolate reductase
MEMIVAVNKLGYIGKDGNLMWKCSDDLKWFKEVTMGKKCLVGRKTFESLPPLKGRELIVVSKSVLQLEDALKLNPDIVIGGGEIYRKTIDLIDTLYLSIIDDEQIGDTKFPTIPNNIKIIKKRFC